MTREVIIQVERIGIFQALFKGKGLKVSGHCNSLDPIMNAIQNLLSVDSIYMQKRTHTFGNVRSEKVNLTLLSPVSCSCTYSTCMHEVVTRHVSVTADI